jgi:hypothetical protein
MNLYSSARFYPRLPELFALQMLEYIGYALHLPDPLDGFILESVSEGFEKLSAQ